MPADDHAIGVLALKRAVTHRNAVERRRIRRNYRTLSRRGGQTNDFGLIHAVVYGVALKAALGAVTSGTGRDDGPESLPAPLSVLEARDVAWPR